MHTTAFGRYEVDDEFTGTLGRAARGIKDWQCHVFSYLMLQAGETGIHWMPLLKSKKEIPAKWLRIDRARCEVAHQPAANGRVLS